MKLKDILDKKLVMLKDTDCNYYWDYKYVVEIDEDNYALINHSGSGSGYCPLHFEFVDKEFAYQFFKGEDWETIKFEKTDENLGIYTGNDEWSFQDDWNGTENYGELEVIVISKEYVMKKYEEATNERTR